jgi:hypothetical protein
MLFAFVINGCLQIVRTYIDKARISGWFCFLILQAAIDEYSISSGKRILFIRQRYSVIEVLS